MVVRHAPNVIIVPPMRITAAGDRGLMVTLPGASAARLRAIAEASRRIEGVVAAIVGHESVYVIGTTDRDAMERAANDATEAKQGAIVRHEIEVSFAPEHALDFGDLIARADLPRDAIIDRISRLTLTVRYLGFLPGWGYLEGWPEEWAIPRRSTSRNRVPGGSFAVANVMAGFYPVDSPGGWNILGRTDALPRLHPGDEIRVKPVTRALVAPLPASRREGGRRPGEGLFDVVRPGQMTTLVEKRDESKLEQGDIAGGPFDEQAAATANEAVGNEAGAPLFECVLVGPKLRFREACRVAFCGMSCEPQTWTVGVGEEVDIGRITDGLRGYLAWSGAPPPRRRFAAEGRGAPHLIRIIRGPHDAPPLPENWEVTPNMNRTGIRLKPLDAIAFKPPAELPSCGMQFGTLQWHPDGSVVAMGPDHPVTGGYLQPATVIRADLWKLAQLAPGERVRLVD